MPLGGSVSGIRSISYQGPGDIVSGAAAWWGLRAYSSSTIGNNIVRLRRSDTTEQDFAAISGGGLDEAAITSFSAGALTVTKLYDQTGNGKDLTQTTVANQPTLTRSGLGSKSIITFVGATPTRLVSTADAFLGQLGNTTTMTGALWLNSTVASTAFYLANNGGSFGIGGNGTANRLFGYQGGGIPTTSAAADAWHSLIVIFKGDSTSQIVIDGSSTSVDLGSTVPGAGNCNLDLGYTDGPSLIWDGKGTEAGVWTTSFSSGNYADMNTNIRTFWGY